MANSNVFVSAPLHLHTSESVTEGHPDKICDQVADAILDEILTHDSLARVACEVTCTTGLVVVLGEITTAHHVDYTRITRQVIREIGYTHPEYGFEADSCGIIVSIKEQSREIAQAVERPLEVRGEVEAAEELGAGDQGIMIGFACDETPELMPMPIALSHKLCRRLAEVRHQGLLPYLRPDGKSQVTVEYSYGRPKRVEALVLSAHHDPSVGLEQLRHDLRKLVIDAVVPPGMIDAHTKPLINPSGSFVVGGPHGDSGLSGRKNIVDTYGCSARHGGGSYSGKDPTKVDRSASYAARYVAKNIVAAGLAGRIEVELSYAIGVAHPVSIGIETFGTHQVDPQVILQLIHRHFDLRPAAIIRDLDLRRPLYKATAVYGHFGREDLDLPWERLDKADLLRKEGSILAGSRRPRAS